MQMICAKQVIQIPWKISLAGKFIDLIKSFSFTFSIWEKWKICTYGQDKPLSSKNMSLTIFSHLCHFLKTLKRNWFWERKRKIEKNHFIFPWFDVVYLGEKMNHRNELEVKFWARLRHIIYKKFSTSFSVFP